MTAHALLWNRTAVDFAVLPAALLTAQKAHNRVEFARDDALITRNVGWAISIIERHANINIVPATYRSVGYAPHSALAWGICLCPLPGVMGYRLPFNNVRAIRLFDADDADVTGEWEVVQERFGSNSEAYAINPSGAGAPSAHAIELDVGTDDATKIDPAVMQCIERFAASAYEYREANLDLAGDGFTSELSAIWRPCA